MPGNQLPSICYDSLSKQDPSLAMSTKRCSPIGSRVSCNQLARFSWWSWALTRRPTS